MSPYDGIAVRGHLGITLAKPPASPIRILQGRYRARHKFDMEAELRNALEAGHFTAHFQPQQCLKIGAIGGVEALAHWTRPNGTTVPPSDFIPVTKDTIGISDILFETILRDVCDAGSRWRADGPWAVPIGGNMSTHQLCNRDLVSLIKSILEQHRIDPQLINLELTETVLLEDLAMAARAPRICRPMVWASRSMILAAAIHR